MLLCLARPIQCLVALFILNDRKTGSDGTTSTNTLDVRQNSRPPTRRIEQDSEEWACQAYAMSISEDKQTWKPLQEMPSMPTTANTSSALESYGGVSVDSRVDDPKNFQLVHDLEREGEARVTAGRRA